MRAEVEMDRVAPNTWACLVMLGEARREQFRILVNGDASQAPPPMRARARTESQWTCAGAPSDP